MVESSRENADILCEGEFLQADMISQEHVYNDFEYRIMDCQYLWGSSSPRW